MLPSEILATERLRRLSAKEYDRLVDSGTFEAEHVELLEGVIVEMSPQGTRHYSVVMKLNAVLSRLVGTRAMIGVQGPFGAGKASKPEPDIAVVPVRSYDDAHPSKAFLIIEVADSSLHKDRVIKPRIYAAARVPEYWVIDVHASTVLRMTKPRAGKYTHTAELGKRDSVALVAFPDVVVKLRDVLP
jgi:hypothetical protein